MNKVISLLVFLIGILTVIDVGYNSTNIYEFKLYIPTYDILTKEHKKEIDCLSRNIYREASGEKEEGMTAVALVTMNRTKATGYPNTVCKVVHQKRNAVCQFTWVCMRKLSLIDKEIYNYSRYVAIRVFFNHYLMNDITQRALFYHANYVNPRWNNLVVTTIIGNHIFYKTPGEI